MESVSRPMESVSLEAVFAPSQWGDGSDQPMEYCMVSLLTATGLDAYAENLGNLTLSEAVAMAESALDEMAEIAGMSRADRKTFASAIKAEQPMVDGIGPLLKDNGLGAYERKLRSLTLSEAIAMKEDVLDEMAENAGMGRAERNTFLSAIKAEQPVVDNIGPLLKDSGLGAYEKKLRSLTLSEAIAMKDDILDETAEKAGMGRADRKTFLSAIKAEQPLVDGVAPLLKENGLDAYDRKLRSVTLSEATAMKDDALDEMAEKAGMGLAERICFLSAIKAKRDDSSKLPAAEGADIAEPPQKKGRTHQWKGFPHGPELEELPIERLPQPERDEESDQGPPCSLELINFLKPVGLDKFAPALTAGKCVDVPTILAMADADLIGVVVDAGMQKTERDKFMELVTQTKQDILNQSSIAKKLAESLRGIARVQKTNGTSTAEVYMPFTTDKEHTYMHKFPAGIVPPTHRCSIRVMKANVPQEFVDETVDKDIILLVVGATGAGKSTQIDGVLNYILGAKWHEEYRFKVVDESITATPQSVKQGSAASQTDDITAYKLPAFIGGRVQSKVTIIDTPGFGDTRGLHFDQKIADQLSKFFKHDVISKAVPCLTAVCFVTQASLPRLTESQEYVWTSILGIFGKDVANNIVLNFTFADGKEPQALAAVAASGIPVAASFKFNNSALFADPRAQVEDTISKQFWDMGISNMEVFFDKVKNLSDISLTQTRAVMTEKEQLEVTLETLPTTVQCVLSKVNNLRNEAALIETLTSEKLAAADFEYTIDKPHGKKTPTKNNTTTCIQCDHTCHTNCRFADDDQKKNCSAMKDGWCTQCPAKCSWQEHRNMPYIFEIIYVKTKQTAEDLKRRFDKANTGVIDKQAIMTGLASELATAENAARALIMKLKACKERLAVIALRPNSLPSGKYIEMMITNEKRNQKMGWEGRVQVLENLKTKSNLLKDIHDPSFDPLKGMLKKEEVAVIKKHIKTKSQANGWLFKTVG